MGHAGIIVSEGLYVVAAAAALAALFWALGWYRTAAVFMAVALFCAWFFRNPERTAPVGEGLVVAPADGKVVFAGEVDEARYLEGRAVKVSIFMNIFDVHVNRVPESGKVEAVRYNPGKFFSANLDKASLDNEQNAVFVDAGGMKIAFVQIAGLVARRIVCWARPGDTLVRGERFGMIMFGSRLDVYMPPETALKVSVGDRTRAGETVIGALP